MADQITITSMNCQGLGNYDKRKDVLNFLKQKKYSIYCLQDTHFTEREENYIRAQWGFECFFSSYNSQSRGVAILFNNNFEYKLNRIKKDQQGNKLILDMTILGKKILLVNIYGPNRDKPNFYDNLKTEITEFNTDFVITVGDFNLVLNQEKDTKNYTLVNNPRAKEKVLDLCAELNLIDIWRDLHIEKKQYTWTTKNRHKQARLDFFLITEGLCTYIEDAKIETGYRSDHSCVTLFFKGKPSNKGQAFWKFNNSLLKDPKFITEIKKVIENVKQQYIKNDHNTDDLSSTNTQFSINDQLFLETLLMEIRGKTISYASFKKKQIDKTEQILLQEISILEENNININLLEEKRQELREIRDKKLEGLKIRSRAKWIDQGEKVTKYFCNLENRNYVSKNMPHLFKKNGLKTETDKEILDEVSSFYENLYEAKQVKDIDLNNILNHDDIPKLDNNESKKLEGKITKEEALNSLKNMKNNKSPGSDGFTIEFFKFFWPDIGDLVVRAINTSFELQELSNTQKEGVIICIPKGDKDKQQLKNWRPISLLNVTYKIASSCIANRVKTVLPKLIHQDQTGFISGRYIGQNIRNIYDILHYTEKYQIPGLLLLIDFEKAFDSVAWTFISKVLDFFNFGESIKKWIAIFYKNIKSCVIVNGQISKWFKISRGCRQGDPLSPYIFILCAEILALMIRKNKQIKGITIKGIEYLVSQYADDTSITLDATETSLKNTLLVLKFYAEASGLHVNMEKTKVIWFGSRKGSETKLCENWNLCWEQGQFTLLGIKFSINLADMIEINYKDKIREIKNLLIQWSKRILTPYGRITVLKSLAIAKINHLLLSLPNPTQNMISELNSMFFKFLWNGKIDKIKRDVTIKTYKEGGLKMIKVESFIQALKITWIRRIIQEDTKGSNLLYAQYPNMTEFSKFGTDYIRSKLTNLDNRFWYDTFSAWIKFTDKLSINSWSTFLSQPLWYNNFVKVGGKSIFYKNWADNGIYFINDLVNSEGKFYDYNTIVNILNTNVNFLQVQGLIRALNFLQIRFDLASNDHDYNLQQPICPSSIRTLTTDKKGSKRIYKILSSNDRVPWAQTKWKRDLNLPLNFKWDNTYNICYKITQDTKLHWLQYRLLHRILSTNQFLCKIGIKEDNLCTFCNNSPETLIHIFWECPIINNFWKNIETWLKGDCVHIRTLNLSKEDIILQIDNNQKSDKVLNFIILLIKSYIYNMKYKENVPHINNLKKILVSYYNSEKFIAYSNCTWYEFNKQWLPYYNLIQHC